MVFLLLNSEGPNWLVSCDCCWPKGRLECVCVCVCVFVRSQTVKGRTQKLQGVWTSPSKHREMCHSCFCLRRKAIETTHFTCESKPWTLFCLQWMSASEKKTLLFTAFNKELLSYVRCYALKYNESIHLQKLHCLLRQASLLLLFICDLNKLPTRSIRHLLRCFCYRREWYLKLCHLLSVL